MPRRKEAILLFTLVLTASSALAANLDLTPLHRSFQFNFSFPGARSLGMGGAFIGRADDASAAEANPAGLTVLVSPEVTVEVRNLDYAEDAPYGLQGSPSAATLHVSHRQTAPSFFSLVYPTPAVSWALFYSRPLDFQQTASIDIGTGVIGGSGSQAFFFGNGPGDFALHYRAETLGVSAAWKIGGLSLGAGVRRERLKADASFAQFDVAFSGGVPVKGSAVPTSFGLIHGSESKYAYTAGLKWQNAPENFSVGAVYKSGADYSFKECNPSSASTGCETAPQTFPSTFEVPPQLGAGISIRPMKGVTLNADVVRVQYDRLLRHFEPAGFCAIASCASAESFGFKIDNATEVHIGGEWAFPGAAIPLALRAGWWRDPDHSVRYSGPTNDTDADVRAAQNYAAFTFTGQSSQNHVAFGLGYIRPTFEINAAYDHSRQAKTGSISALKRF
jgi:long-subunit fatty acid transport protein